MKSHVTIHKEMVNTAHHVLNGNDAPMTYGGAYLQGAIAALSWALGAKQTPLLALIEGHASTRAWPVVASVVKRAKKEEKDFACGKDGCPAYFSKSLHVRGKCPARCRWNGNGDYARCTRLAGHPGVHRT